MQNYKTEIQNLNNPTFQKIREIASSTLSHLTQNERNDIWQALDRGKKVIETEDELSQYLFSFGNMHEEKILRAIENIDIGILNNDLEIIDWGCGQGLATITFLDFMKRKGYSGKAKKVTLIEPSSIALKRAVLHTKCYKKQVDTVVAIEKYLDDVCDNEIQAEEGSPVIHFFSNILDIKEIDLLNLSNKIKQVLVSDNIIVSVGPVYMNNNRLDRFYTEYFQRPEPLIFNINETEYQYGLNKKCTFKAKVYKIEYSEKGNLIPKEFYPSVQFHSSYQLDGVNKEYQKKVEVKTISQSLAVFETSTSFDIGASVYDDIHPILAVLNNIITRGLPTKASPFIEDIFQKTFHYSERFVKYGTFSYPQIKETAYEEILFWYNSIILKERELDYSKFDIEQLQIVFSPVAIARVQKTILEALMADKLDFNDKEWRILVVEKDVPCSAIAFEDLAQIFYNLTKLSKDFQSLIFPSIKLDIISNEIFVNSDLHLNNKNTSQKIEPQHSKTEYDLVIDISIFETSKIEKGNFSKFKCKNDCYFNIRAAKEIKSERNIYTTDKIIYRDIVSSDSRGNYVDINETKELLEYFLQLIFRKETFRVGQLPILNRALQNKSVIGLLPTGGGKSLTYQLAAFLQPGVTLIVDPLRSLMKDQYDGLISAGIDNCAYINSSQTILAKNEAERKLEQSKLLFIFLSPERLAIYKFREKLKNMHELNVYFSYGVIDEVHCVSEWGHDFRFTYLHLGRNLYRYVRAKVNEISLFGLTATASFDVLADVERELSGNGAFLLDSETIVRYENSNRLEIQYKIEKVNVEFVNEIEALQKSKYASLNSEVSLKNKYKLLIDNHLPVPVKVADKWRFFDAKNDYLQNYIKLIPGYLNEIQSKASIKKIKSDFEKRQGNSIGIGIENGLETYMPENYFSRNSQYDQAGIVFCPHKANTGISVQKNRESLIDIVPDVGTFSGGDDEDNENQSIKNLELFRDNKQPIMVATKAFGMGIDKPNVRFTVNLNYSSSLESFVQEAGRGGRDRKMALSVILLSDYKLAKISNKLQNLPSSLNFLKGKWFKPDDLQQIINYFNINADSQMIDYLTPGNDLVRLFCKDGSTGKYFSFKNCNDYNCRIKNKCQLKKVPKEAENWIFIDDLFEILKNNNITIDKKYIEYQNADYETVMYFYNNSFKGEVFEKQSMHKILSLYEVDMFYGDNSETKEAETSSVKGFLNTLIEAEKDQEIVSFIRYIKPYKNNEGNATDIAKAIYRMTCIELIEDFTQDYSRNHYRIVSKRKEEGEYYKGLERFLLRYYSADRAKEEMKNVFDVKVISNSILENEIFQCLSYLTTFVYEKISIKRKRAIDDIRTFCITGANDSKDWKETNEDLKDFIFYYFNSKYAKRDYVAENGEPYSILIDSDEGKISADWILFKYLKIIDDKIEGGVPIDNVKHLQGAVRLFRLSITDANPMLSLLNSFCISYLGTNHNEVLEKELVISYKEGMVGFYERMDDKKQFWDIIFEPYNLIISNFIEKEELNKWSNEVEILVHAFEVSLIEKKYLTGWN